jgi:hypothetical protein
VETGSISDTRVAALRMPALRQERASNGVTVNTVDIVHRANAVKFSLNYKFGGDPWGKSPVVAKY